jgi:hypothetical protein
MNTLDWLKKGDYLPSFLKDFHDQKDVFKLLNRIITLRNKSDHSNLPNWINAQIYTIDIFLWCMAFYGYKLQKIKTKDIVFGNLADDIKKMKDEQAKQFVKILNEQKTDNKTR